MKILVLSKESRGGTGNLLHQLQTLHNAKRSIDFYFYKRDPKHSVTKNLHYLSETYPNSHRPSITKIWLFIKNSYLTLRLLNKEKYQIVFTCDHYSSLQILFLKHMGIVRFHENSVIVLENNNLEKVIANKPLLIFRIFLRFITKSLYKSADKIVTTSQGLKDNTSMFLSFPPERIILISRSIDLDLLSRMKRIPSKAARKMKKTKGIKLITVGRLEKQKDFDTIFKSVALVKERIPEKDIYLFIVGEGSQQKRLAHLAADLHIEDFVHFLGWQRNVYPLLAESDIFLFASVHEGFGLVLVEAMACGLPVISTDTPFGPSETTNKGEYGILIPMGNAQEMANGIVRLLKDKKLYGAYSRKSRMRSRKYSQKIMLKEYSDLFDGVNLNES